MGKFGWIKFGAELLPFIQIEGVEYCAVRMLEMKVFAKYFNYLSSDIFSCTNIQSFSITEDEAKLLTQINLKHCEGRFGSEAFTTYDVVVQLVDASEFYYFLELCYTKLRNPLSPVSRRCGFLKVNNEYVIPYTVVNKKKYVPLFYIEGESEKLSKLSIDLSGWELAYLKFLCKLEGICEELLSDEMWSVVSFAVIKAFWPSGTIIDEYWPQEITDPNILIHNNPGRPASNVSTSWFKAPHGEVDEFGQTPANAPVSNGWIEIIPPALFLEATEPERVPTNQLGHSNQSEHNSTSLGSTQPTQVVPQVQPPSLTQQTSANHSMLDAGLP